METLGPTRRDRIIDIAVVLLAAGWGLLTYAAEYPGGPAEGTLATVDLVTGLVACVALFWRRRWPVHLAALAIPVGAFSTAAGGAGVALLFTVALYREFRVVAPLAALNGAVAFAYVAIHPDPDVPYLVFIGLVLAILGATVAWGMYVRARRQLLASLRERAERAEAEQQLRASQARDGERRRIAREMHDVLAHRISLLSMHAGALEFRPDAPPEEIARAAGVIRDSAHHALEDLREVIGVLRSDAGESLDVAPDGAPARPQPTLTDLAALLDESRDAGMRIRDDVVVDLSSSVPTSTARTVYRVVQEGLTNARKHADGAAVNVRVSGSPERGLVAEISNPAPAGGSVRSAIPGAGTGIVGLAERATLAGGRLEHGPTEDGGFVLRAWLPWSS